MLDAAVDPGASFRLYEVDRVVDGRAGDSGVEGTNVRSSCEDHSAMANSAPVAPQRAPGTLRATRETAEPQELTASQLLARKHGLRAYQ